MEIITTHANTDLDGLASMVAAQKLYPGAVMVFPGKLSRSVEEFLALHKDTLNIMAVRNIDQRRVKRVILVDIKTPGRLANLARLLEIPGVDIHIYDHHPRGEGDVSGSVEVVEMVGATTTLMVEIIRERGLELTPMEATILSLGIYEDTGSLVFAGTTSRDAEAVAYLLSKGANLAVVAEFLDRPLTDDQRALLKTLLVSTEHYEISGVKFLIATARVDEYIGDLSLLTHKIADFTNVCAVFTVVEMDGCVCVVARSSVKEVNAKEIMEVLGGGGHIAAASASVKKARVEEVKERLLGAIRSKVRPPITVADIMSSPVKTVTPETVIEEAGQVMLRYGHTGLPVVKGERIVGVISRRDVEKAAHHGLGHAPVKGFMTNNLVTVNPGAPATVVRDLMIEHDIGRLPVIDCGRLVGIVSRTDVLRSLHGEAYGRYYKVYAAGSYAHENAGDLMSRQLPAEYMDILMRAGEIASCMGYKVYAAGGIVRDLLLGVECLDIDLVVEGDGIELAKVLCSEYGAKVRVHPKFYTATALFPSGRQVDVATARVEFYQYPAAMPQVEASSLHQDLYRRDFTINAMAISLNKDNFGEIVDFFGGREDLAQGLLRVLHNLSFVEDPTRLLRGIRFEKRYQMSLESLTLRLAKEAVNNDMLARVSSERVWEELKYILLEPRPGPALSRLNEIGLWEFLFPGVRYTEIEQALNEMLRSLNALRSWEVADPNELWMVYFIAIMHRTDITTAGEICRLYRFNKRQHDKVAATISSWRDTVEGIRNQGSLTRSELVRRVMSVPRESHPLVLTYLTDFTSRRKFRHILTTIRCDKPTINGKDLRAMGFKPGPAFKKTLDAVWQARLDGLVRTREEELGYAREYLLGYEGAIDSV